MAWRTNGLLLLALTGVGVVLYYNAEPVKPVTEVGHMVLQGRRCADAEKILFRSGPQVELVELTRQENGRFRITEPVDDLASTAFLRNLFATYDSANLLHDYQDEDFVKHPTLEADIGLLEPKGHIEFRFADSVIKLQIGNDTLYGEDALYVRLGGKVYRGSRALYTSIQVNTDHVRQALLFSEIGEPMRLQLDRLQPDGEVESLLLEAVGQEFRFRKPQDMRANLPAVTDLISGLMSLRVTRFLKGSSQSVVGMRQPDYRIVLTGTAGSEELLMFGSVNGQVSGDLKQRRVSFVLDQQRGFAPLVAKLEDLRSRILLPATGDDIQKIELDAGPGHVALVLQRGSGRSFQIIAPVKSETDPTGIGQMLQSLRDLRVLKFLDQQSSPDILQDLGLATPLTLRIYGRQSQRPVEVLLGRQEGDRVYAKRRDEPFISEVDAAAVQQMRQPLTALISKKICALTLPFARLEVQVPGQQEPLVYQKKDGDWFRRDPESGQSTPDLDVLELAEAVVSMRAREVVDIRGEQPGEPVVLHFMRLPEQREILLTLQLLRLDHGRLLVLPPKPMPGFAYEVNQAALRQLMQQWLK